jgi:hypothetical protein
MYDPKRILLGITRHSLYSERLLLLDPFVYPMTVRDEYNPVLHPEQHRSTTLRWAWLWLMMAPWIEADLVHFIRTPGHFDVGLEFEAMRITRERYERRPELEELARRQAKESDGVFDSYKQQVLLGFPDEYYRQLAREEGWATSEEEVEGFVRGIQEMRAKDPFVLDPLHEDRLEELHHFSSGASYEMAKWTAALSGSHLITDIESRWAEIRVDREEANVHDDEWTPFAKAFAGLPFKYLNAVPLDAALELRRQDRLADLRACLGKAWRANRDDDGFSDRDSENLAQELRELIRESEAEWADIQASLAKFIGGELAVGALGIGPAIAAGGAVWAAAGVAATGAANVVAQRLKEKAYIKRHPASFFLHLSKEHDT